MIAKIVLLLGLGSLCVLGTRGSKVEELLADIFSPSGPVLSTTQTLERLQRLRFFLKDTNNNTSNNNNTPLRELIDRLTNISKRLLKCDNRESVAIYDRLLGQFGPNGFDGPQNSYANLANIREDQKSNAYRYVVTLKEERFRYCSELISGKIHEALSLIGTETLNKLTSMATFLSDYIRNNPNPVMSNQRADGCLGYMLEFPEFRPIYDNLKLTGRRREFNSFFKREILDPCNRIEKILFKHIESYEKIREFVRISPGLEYWNVPLQYCLYYTSMTREYKEYIVAAIAHR